MNLASVDYALDYSFLSFLLAVGVFGLAMWVFHWLVRTKDIPPLFGYTFLLLTVAGVVGAWGRWSEAELDPAGDHTIRVLLVALRLAIIVLLLLDGLWLWRRLRREDH